MQKDPQFITALSHGLLLLDCFSPAQPVLTNSALARLTGMPRSSISRLTHTLVKVGYLDYDADGGAYRLGVKVLSLQPAALAAARAVETVAPYVEELAHAVRSRAMLTVYEGYGMTVLQSASDTPPTFAAGFVGCRHPVPARATGRAFMASWSEHEQENFVAHQAQGDASAAAALRCELAEAVRTHRSQGYCMSLGQVRPGHNSIGVTISLPHLGRRAGLGCGGPAELLPERVMRDRVAPLLMRIGGEMERASAGFAARRREPARRLAP